ncbi:MAG TPA: class I SAM-dependent methyltransferase [Actinopolymorphaceae bacterium]
MPASDPPSPLAPSPADRPPTATTERESVRINRAHWDALAAVHGTGHDRIYDIDALVAGHNSMTSHELAAVRDSVGDVAGLDVLHVQCHLGFDSISLARAGAHVTAVDVSPMSLAKAADIAERCGVQVDWVEADAMQLPPYLHGRFDLAYATFGVLAWIEDLQAWMDSVAACLRPGGQLAIVELHPVFSLVSGTDPLRLWPTGTYSFAGPEFNDDDGSYASPKESVRSTAKVFFAHDLGEIVTTAIRAGLTVTALSEHTSAEFDPTGWLLHEESDGAWRVRSDGVALPVLFTLLATSPPARTPASPPARTPASPPARP